MHENHSSKQLADLNSHALGIFSRLLKDIVSGCPNARVLDVGCGDFPYLRSLKISELNITLWDMQIPQNIPGGITFEQKSFWDDTSSQKFDIVILSTVFHELYLQWAMNRIADTHVPLAERGDFFSLFFARLHNLLNHNGKVIFAENNNPDFSSGTELQKARLFQLKKYKHADSPAAFISPDVIVRNAIKNGFKISYFDDIRCIGQNHNIFSDPEMDEDVRFALASRRIAIIVFENDKKEQPALPDKHTAELNLDSLDETLRCWSRDCTSKSDTDLQSKFHNIFFTGTAEQKSIFHRLVCSCCSLIDDYYAKHHMCAPQLLSFWPSFNSAILRTRYIPKDDMGEYCPTLTTLEVDDWNKLAYNFLSSSNTVDFIKSQTGCVIKIPSLFECVNTEPSIRSITITYLRNGYDQNEIGFQEDAINALDLFISKGEHPHKLFAVDFSDPFRCANTLNDYFDKQYYGESNPIGALLASAYLDFLFLRRLKTSKPCIKSLIDEYRARWLDFLNHSGIQKSISNAIGKRISVLCSRASAITDINKLPKSFITFGPQPHYKSTDEVGKIHLPWNIMLFSERILPKELLAMIINSVDNIFDMIHAFEYKWSNLKHIFELRLLATHSAIGSIMSRNGSHNIGSHVLAALTHHVGTMPDDRVLYQYLQQRMDYIATVTTDFPSWGTSTMFVGDMMKTFFSQRHLLEYISGSEGLHSYRFQDPNLGEKERLGQTGKIKLFIRRIRKNINSGDESGEKPDWSLINEAGDHALHFIRYPEKTGIHFIDYKDDSPLPLEHDVALAIPGGVIGEHAFFTILENIIRNAAKHGWGAHSRRADNLEVYIDFIDDPEKDHIQFTVWDNMSDVLKAYNAAADETRKKIDHILHPAEQSNGTKDPHEPLHRKKGEIEALQKAWDDKKIDIKDLPLHWQLQLQLNQQLITEQGELRRENWGLAEMRISAGYLQQRSVGQIGGLEPLEKEEEKEAENQAPSGASGQDEEKKNEEDHIILPVAVPGVCTHPDNPNGGIRCSQCTHHGRSDCPIRNNLYHLGYRFKVPKPREMLIVLPQDPTPPENLPEFKKAGVYFAQADGNGKCSFCDNGEKVKNFNFDYVVFPDEPTAIKCGQKLGEKKIPAERWRSLFPFRLLYLNPTWESNTQKVKNLVYQAWIGKLKSEYGIKDALLSMQLQTEGSDSRGGRGLITDRDLLDFVFRNNFHSVITNLLGSADLSDAPESSRDILKLLACYPSPADKIPQLIGGDICDMIAQILKRCCDDLRKDYREIGKEHDKAGGIVRDFVASYRAKIVADDDANAVLRDIKPEEFKIQMEMFTGEKPEADDDDFNALDFIFGNRKSAPSDESPFSALVDPAPPVLLRLAKALFAAYQTADTLLRKYEERIVTLPRGYSANSQSGQTAAPALNEKLEAVGIELVNSGSPLIKYCRHDKYRGKDTIYAEALSGSQSYLNTLSRITRENKEEHTGTFVKLAENALIRLLIIDERVSNFLKAHPANVSTFDAMNIDVVDVTDKKPEEAITATQNGKNINLESLTLITSGSQSGKKWDMLIIHQGVIDKWFTEHKKEQVGSLIENLTQAVPYTVVTTGRGRPDNIPDWVKILPFSMLESTLFRNYPEKMLLVAAVMNALPNPSEK